MCKIIIVLLTMVFFSCSSVEKKEEIVQQVDQAKTEETIQVEPVKVEESINPCDPNPCTEQNKTICKPDKEAFVCECNKGFEYIAGICTNKKVLVLSVGAERGIAHFGAIKAFNEKNIKFDAVFGNSMGALVGSFYVYTPKQDIYSGYQRLLSSIFPDGFWGKATAVVKGAAKKYVFGQSKNDQFSDRLNEVYMGALIENTTIPFATSFFKIENQHLSLETVKKGNLAAAVAKSINHPVIFNDVNIKDIKQMDPGFDRTSAIPVEDACEFAHERFGLSVIPVIYAVNTTDDKIIYSSKMNCKVVEIRIPPLQNIDAEKALMGKDPDFKNIADHGYKIVKEALERN